MKKLHNSYIQVFLLFYINGLQQGRDRVRINTYYQYLIDISKSNNIRIERLK